MLQFSRRYTGSKTMGMKVCTAVETGTTVVARSRWNAVLPVSVATTPSDRPLAAHAPAAGRRPAEYASLMSFVTMFVRPNPAPEATVTRMPVSHRVRRTRNGGKAPAAIAAHTSATTRRPRCASFRPGAPYATRATPTMIANTPPTSATPRLAELPHSHVEQQEEADSERRLHDDERRIIERDDLRPYPDDAEQPADDPAPPATQQPEDRETKPERKPGPKVEEK